MAVAIEYLKKAIETGGSWARTTLVLIMDNPQNTTVITIRSMLNGVLSFLLLFLRRFATAGPRMLTISPY